MVAAVGALSFFLGESTIEVRVVAGPLGSTCAGEYLFYRWTLTWAE